MTDDLYEGEQESEDQPKMVIADQVLVDLMARPQGRAFLADLVRGYDSCVFTEDPRHATFREGVRSNKVQLVERMKELDLHNFTLTIRENYL